jgi:uncharacterized protein (TIGR00369 family)
MYAQAPIHALVRGHLRVAHGEAEVRVPLRPDFHHGAGAVHGSIYFRALDDAAFFAAASLVHDVFVLTVHFELELLRPVIAGEMLAKAEVVERDERRIHASGELFDGEGQRIARGRGRFARSKIVLGPALHYA